MNFWTASLGIMLTSFWWNFALFHSLARLPFGRFAGSETFNRDKRLERNPFLVSKESFQVASKCVREPHGIVEMLYVCVCIRILFPVDGIEQLARLCVENRLRHEIKSKCMFKRYGANIFGVHAINWISVSWGLWKFARYSMLNKTQHNKAQHECILCAARTSIPSASTNCAICYSNWFEATLEPNR